MSDEVSTLRHELRWLQWHNEDYRKNNEKLRAEAARYRAALEDIERGVRTFCDAQGQPTCEPVDYEALVLAYHRTLGHCRDIVDRALHPEEGT